jgi:hypothetical protein
LTSAEEVDTLSKSHNKKRNVTLVYEFLVQTIAQALVEGNKKRSSGALKIIKRRFKPGTELCKEFRLANSLLKTTVSSEFVASSILGEAKQASRKHDTKLLDKEKSMLVHEINCVLGTQTFEQRVQNYVDHATVASLINEWRSDRCDISLLALYEDKLVKMLVADKTKPDTFISEGSNVEDKLVIDVMSKRLDEKYGDSLTEQHKKIVKAYALGENELLKEAVTLKNELLKEISLFKCGALVAEKLAKTKELLLNEKFDVSSDDVAMKCIEYANLLNELKSEEENA